MTFCRMVQRGLFVVFVKTHSIQERVLNKKFWNVGKSLFKAFSWLLTGNVEEVSARVEHQIG